MEIERKFLVHSEIWENLSKPNPVKIAQGYLYADASKTIRVRIKGDKGFITIKGETVGISRQEFEYPIPVLDAEKMLKTLCSNIIEKYRYEIPFKGFVWEVDVFEGENKGLVVAEVELESEEEKPDLPNWVAEEVSHDIRYFNSQLSKKPFTQW